MAASRSASPRDSPEDPRGPPEALGPGNPFWSQRARDELTLREMRPRNLPPLELEYGPVRAGRVPGDGAEVLPGPTMVATEDGVAFAQGTEAEMALVQVRAGQVLHEREPPGVRGEPELPTQLERFMLTVMAQNRALTKELAGLRDEVGELRGQVGRSADAVGGARRDTLPRAAEAREAAQGAPVQQTQKMMAAESMPELLRLGGLRGGVLGTSGGKSEGLAEDFQSVVHETIYGDRSGASSAAPGGGDVPPPLWMGQRMAGFHPGAREGHRGDGAGERTGAQWGGAQADRSGGYGGHGGKGAGGFVPTAGWASHERYGGVGWDESVRTVELPALPELNDGDLGPLAEGDWLALIAPVMKDLSGSSAAWWEAIMKEAAETYEKWLHAEPLVRIQLQPMLPAECLQQPWLRLEQRGSTMLLKARPEEMKTEALANRMTSSVELVYRVLKRYQPGGLGERTHLLKQLVDTRTPTSVQEMIHQLQMWRRWVRRARELRINIPDPTLLIGTLDKLSVPLVKTSAQVAFRLSTVRAQLLVDVRPSLEGVMSFAETLQAEGEVVFLSGEKSVIGPKVKALGGVDEKTDRPRVMDDGLKKADSKKQQPCRFFLSQTGCKKGSACGFPHESDGKMRCWQCGSLEHVRKDCHGEGSWSR